MSDTLTRHSGEEIATIGHPDAIRAAMDRDTRAGAMTWELCAQLMRDPETMPVEDPRVEWPEDESPLLPVARLRVEAQPSFDAAAARAAGWLERHRMLRHALLPLTGAFVVAAGSRRSRGTSRSPAAAAICTSVRPRACRISRTAAPSRRSASSHVSASGWPSRPARMCAPARSRTGRELR